jgi:hypothetical protein
MTIPSTPRRAGPYLGTGALVSYSFGFKIFDRADVAVTIADTDGNETLLTLDSNVLVTANPDQVALPGGTVQYAVAGVATALPSGYSLTILTAVEYKQATQLPSGGNYRAEVVEQGLDALAVQIQQQQEVLGRALVFSPTDVEGSTLPPAANRADRLLGFDSAGRVAVVAPVSGSAAALAIDLASTASVVKGPALVGHGAALNYAAATIGAALNDQQAQMMWFVTSEVERAAIKAGTSTTDHTSTIAAAITTAGTRGLDFGPAGWRWNISAALVPVSGATYSGKAKIRAINAAAITGAMFRAATAVSRVTIRDLELDANGDNNGANYGVWITGGSYNVIERVYVHDTRQAGIAIESENGTDVLDCSLLSCGRATSVTGGAATDNHGLMLFSTGATALREIEARGNLVVSAYRKGITTYSASPGTVVNVVISGNVVRTSGLTPSSGGGIYIANAVATTDQDAITLTGNICDGNYVNYEIANVKKVSGSGNVSKASVAQGVVVTSCVDGSLPGFNVSDSGTDGLLLTLCSQIVIGPIEIRRSNRSAAANGAGLHLSASTYSTVSAGSVIYDETPLQKYAVLEDGASDFNDLSGVTVSGALTALYSMVGANTRVSGRTGRNTGVAKALPLNTLHIGGGLTIDEQQLALANGVNQNVALPTNAGTLISNVPTGAYSIGGIAGGHAGRILTLYNYTGFAMTLNHQDAGSTAGNRFSCPSSVNYVVPVQGTVQIQYSAIAGSSWFILG